MPIIFSGIRHRITPAYAGKRPVPSTNVMIFEDHPRLCGEKPIYQHRSPEYLGSPPPMRGKVPPRHCCFMSSRITPAYAGKRHTRSWRKVGKKDHPRLCGEKFLGSPESPFSQGITPAYAGKRPRFIQIHHICWDPPRLCGEKPHLFTNYPFRQGSPPPMRGKA